MAGPGDALFCNECAARKHIENVRWPLGAACIRCQSQNVIRMGGHTQAGMFLCRDCRNKFSARMGTAMEHSHVPLHKWLLALLVATTSEGYLSPQKLKVRLGLGSYRTAWLMTQRIRDVLWRHRQELERRASRRDLNLFCPARLAPSSTRSERGSITFDEALKALVAYPPKSTAHAAIKRERRAFERVPVAGEDCGDAAAVRPARSGQLGVRAVADRESEVARRDAPITNSRRDDGGAVLVST
jgi:transposase-like protein